MFKVLVADPLAEQGIEILKNEQEISVDVKIKMSPKDLISCIAEYDVLLVRSETKVTEEIITAGKKLKIIGRAGVGLDNVNLNFATKHGIIVMNTPDGNTISAAEHTLSMLLALSRNIPQADASLRAKQWNRKQFTGVELYGKILGIIGMGRIGREVAKRALGFKMRIVAYDPFLSPEEAHKLEVELVDDMSELLRKSDYLTFHTPLTSETKHLIGENEIAMMKKNMRIINCARGGIVDESALEKALKTGKIAGAALDVFEKEPPFESALLDLPNVIVTPHLGASTEEAQINVSIAIAHQVIDALKNKVVRNAANVPAVEPETLKKIQPYLTLCEKLGGLISQLIEGHLLQIEVEYSGQITDYNLSPMTVSLIKGLLEPISSEVINYVNAPIFAKERGIKLIESKSTDTKDFVNLITVRAKTDKMEKQISGSIFGKMNLRIVNIDGYEMDVELFPHILVLSNIDKPGVVGNVGSMLGQCNINIAGLQMGRKVEGGNAITVLTIDTAVTSEIIDKLKKLENIIDVKYIKL
ncbi:MAG: phosphoglycerate dehydrogenase [Candidatus Firestonebacteria bacterium]